MTQVSRNRTGFTLIEVLVSLVILSTGIVILLRALQSSVTGLEGARDVLFGTLLCREKLVDIESDIRIGQRPPPAARGKFEGIYAAYRWSVTSVQEGFTAETPAKKPDADEPTPVSLYAVKVDVWHKGREDKQEATTYLRY